MSTINTIIVTRHPALVDLLRERGLIVPDAEVRDHVTPDDVRGKHVVGVLPLHLAAEAASVTEVPLSLPPELRGKELDLDTLRRIAGEAVTYRVERVRRPAREAWSDPEDTDALRAALAQNDLLEFSRLREKWLHTRGHGEVGWVQKIRSLGWDGPAD